MDTTERAETPDEPDPRREILAAFRRPDRALALVLEAPARLGPMLARDRPAWLLSGLLGLAGVVFALPYGALPPVGGILKIPLLFTGSVLICWPSLHVFGAYLGATVSPPRSLALSLLISAVAGAFTLGFFPIVWFLDVTSDSALCLTVGTAGVAVALLALSLLLALFHLFRCIAVPGTLTGRGPGVLLVWIALFLFVTFRMARALGLLG